MSSWFGPGPIEKKVINATSEILIEPDWRLNMELCDMLNGKNDVGKEILKYTRQRIQHKDPRIAFLALMLLEALVKNARPPFLQLVAERDFLNGLVKVAHNTRAIHVREKILELIQSWGEGFGDNFNVLYQSLKRDPSIKFPQVKASQKPPLVTPPKKPQTPTTPSRPSLSQAPTPGGPIQTHRMSTDGKVPRGSVVPPSGQIVSSSSSGGATVSSSSGSIVSSSSTSSSSSSSSQVKSNGPQLDSKETTNPLSWYSPEYILKINSDFVVVAEYLQVMRGLLFLSQTPEQLRKDPGARATAQTLADVRARITQLIVEIDHEELLDVAIKMMEEIQSHLDWHAAKVQGKPWQVRELIIPSSVYKLMEKKGGDDTTEGDSEDLKLAKQLSLRDLTEGKGEEGKQQPQATDDDDDDGDQKRKPTMPLEGEGAPTDRPREAKEKKKSAGYELDDEDESAGSSSSQARPLPGASSSTSPVKGVSTAPLMGPPRNLSQSRPQSLSQTSQPQPQPQPQPSVQTTQRKSSTTTPATTSTTIPRKTSVTAPSTPATTIPSTQPTTTAPRKISTTAPPTPATIPSTTASQPSIPAPAPVTQELDFLSSTSFLDSPPLTTPAVKPPANDLTTTQESVGDTMTNEDYDELFSYVDTGAKAKNKTPSKTKEEDDMSRYL